MPEILQKPKNEEHEIVISDAPIDKEKTFVKKGEVKEVREVDTEANKLKDKVKFPAVPGSKVGFKEMIDWIGLLTPEMKGNLIVYLYRIDPYCIRQLSDPQNPNYIDVLQDLNKEDITEQKITDTHGGGEYDFWINKSDGGTLFKSRLVISKGAYPPKLNYKEVEWNNRKNVGYFAWARGQGIVNEKGEIMAQPNGAPGNTYQQTGISGELLIQFFDKFTGMFNKLSTDQQNQFKQQLGASDTSKGVMDILLEKMKQDDPNKTVGMVTSMITAMKSMIPETKPQESGLASILPFLQMMQSSNDKMTTMMQSSSDKMTTMVMEMMKLQNTGGGKEKSGISEIKEMWELFNEFKGGNAKKSNVEAIADVALPVLLPVMDIIKSVVNLNIIKAGGKVEQPPITVTPNPQPQTNPQPSQEINKLPQPQIEQAKQLLMQYGGMILNSLNGGKKGYEFAEYVVGLAGMQPHAAIANLGTDSLIEAAKQVPEFWNQVANTYGEAYLRNWIDEFINFEKILEDIEGEDEEEGKVN